MPCKLWSRRLKHAALTRSNHNPIHPVLGADLGLLRPNLELRSSAQASGGLTRLSVTSACLPIAAAMASATSSSTGRELLIGIIVL